MKKSICVMGLGYIGLPTAAMFATHGHKVYGMDLNEKIIQKLNCGEILIKEPYLDILVQAGVTSENLVGDTKPHKADVFIICVPTPIDQEKKADLSYVISASKEIVPYLEKDNIVILESTCPTGTVENILLPILQESGLKIGEELFVGHSPERVLPGKILMELVNNNRIVGGINIASANMIKELYRTFVKGEIFITDATTAEMCKIMENTFRDVNIALANELTKICDANGINVWEVIDLCNKHPRVNIHKPGPGVGGHCLAVDPWFIVQSVPDIANIIEMARKTNDNMPQYIYKKIEDLLEDQKDLRKITVLGLTYKANIDDLRESPILHLIELLEKAKKYDISVYDPYVHGSKYLEDNIFEACNHSDLLLLAVDHDCFRELPLGDIYKRMRNGIIFDTRNYFEKARVEEIGFKYHLLGDF